MNKGFAISSFLSRCDRFGQLLLVTDEEVRELFGDELVATVGELERFSREEQVCSGCGGDCCRDLGCELYASRFDSCPIHDLRPIVCRLHFCHRFDATGKSLVIDLRDIFFGCFRAVDFCDSPNLKSLDVPPLAEASPEFVAAIAPWMVAVREGRLDPAYVAESIRCEAEGYRRRCSAMRQTA